MKTSAGILLYRYHNKTLNYFLVHPGGPYWMNKDVGSWSIPKGEFSTDEEPLEAAKREFEEETGFKCDGDFLPLTPVKLKSGKLVFAWALEKDLDADKIKSNSFQIEWPPRSGIINSFPEIDKAAWFEKNEARKKINTSLVSLLDELSNKIKEME